MPDTVNYNLDGTERKNLPMRKHLKGIKVFVFGMPEESGCWFIVNCNSKDCTNQATYWSKTGKRQNRKYTCEDHQN